MKCNKCGTPIIPGENTCRICGNQADFSERVKEPEIIDFLDDEDKEVNVFSQLPDLSDVVDDVEQVDLNSNEELSSVNEVSESEVQTTIKEEIVEPTFEVEGAIALEPILNEKSNEIVSEPIINFEAVNVKEETKEVVEDKNKKNKKVVEKTVEKAENKKNVKKEKKSSNNLSVVLLMIVLLCSLGLNIYLFIMGGNVKSGNNNKDLQNNQVYSKVAYDNYIINMPSTWITENDDTSLLIYDEDQTWAASLHVIDGADYNSFLTNKETLVGKLGNLKYQFTSNYSKNEYNKDFHLFKGKYYDDYSVFVIITELSNSSVLALDLKFKGEVDDILLDSTLKFMAEVKENNTIELFKNNFEFKDISDEIKSVSQKTEE